jgi:hypothetical protein
MKDPEYKSEDMKQLEAEIDLDLDWEERTDVNDTVEKGGKVKWII